MNTEPGTSFAPRTRQAVSGPALDPQFKAGEEELLAYTYGQCHALAMALHQETGWKLAGCNWADGVPKHIFVIDDTGQGVDIHGRHRRGAHPETELCADWQPVSAEQVLAWSDEHYSAMDNGRAEYTAQLMLGISDTIIIPTS